MVGHQLGQPLLALPINVLQLADDQVRERGRLLVIGGPRLEPKIDDLSVGHDHAKLFDLVGHGTEPKRPDPGRIDADHTPQSADPGVDRNRFQPATQGSQLGVQGLEHDAWLDDNAVRRDLDDLSEMAAEVDHDAVAEGTTSRVGSRTASMERDSMLGGIPHDRRDVVLGPRNDHPQRIDLIETCIMRIRRTVQRLEVELTGNEPSQIVIDTGATLIHGRGWPSRARQRN